jgi:hypothetical protein
MKHGTTPKDYRVRKSGRKPKREMGTREWGAGNKTKKLQAECAHTKTWSTSFAMTETQINESFKDIDSLV